MTLEVQFRIKNNQNYVRYLRENSYWYKILNRNPAAINQFEEEVKEKLGLRPADRIGRALDAISLIQNMVSSFK